jgi:hypothetical protein
MGTTVTLGTETVQLANQSDLAALEAQVTTLAAEVAKLQGQTTPPPPPPPVTLTPSPTGTFITTAAGAPIVDDKLNQWRLAAATSPGQTGLQIELMAHGTTTWVVDAPTQNVTELGIQLVNNVRTVVQANAAGGYYENPTGVLGAWAAFGGPVPP